MKVLSRAAMKEADRQTIENFGMPGAVLMETAAIRVVESILARCPEATRVVVLAGPGNNGGDGLAVARLLQNAGLVVSLWSTVPRGAYRGDAGINEQYLEKISFPVRRILDQNDLDRFRENLSSAGLVVDALLGIGVDRNIEGLLVEIMDSINGSGLPVVAVDIPSGINADSGAVMGCAVRASWTVTFAFPKTGLFNSRGVEMAGDIYVGQINIPAHLVDHEPVELLTAAKIKSMLPERPRSAHKASLGRVLIVAGSPGMTGAAVMAGESALRGGAGLVHLAVPQSLYPVIGARLVEVITVALPESGPGLLSPEAAGPIVDRAASCNVLAVGPGLNPGEQTTALLENLIKNTPVPLILDAGALEALIGRMDRLKKADQPVVLTPHPGEMARLTGASVQAIQENRLEVAVKYAREWNSILVLKGLNTVIATPDGRAAINPTGGPALATAGTGDLLTGLIASFIAQGMKAEGAAQAGAFIHGLAGDFVEPGRGHMARDVLDCYKRVFSFLDQEIDQGAINPYLPRIRVY